MPEAARFLEAVERDLSRRLPAGDVPERLAEVAAHLDDAVGAYREMGLPEASAVAAMGEPRRLARELARAALAGWDRRRLHLAAFALAGFGANLAGLSNLYVPGLVPLVTLLSGASALAAAHAAFRARRPNLPGIALSGLALTVPMCLAMALLWLRLPSEDGSPHHIPRAIEGHLRAKMGRNGDGEGLRSLDRALEKPYLLRVAESFPTALPNAASLVVVVGGADLAFGTLGFIFLAAGRRRRGVA